MEPEKSAQKNVDDLTLSYLQKLSHRELTEQFITVSSQFTSVLGNSKEMDRLKSLHTYLGLIESELKTRNLPGATRGESSRI